MLINESVTENEVRVLLKTKFSLIYLRQKAFFHVDFDVLLLSTEFKPEPQKQ